MSTIVSTVNGGVVYRAYVGDITKAETDVIVNAAHEALMGGGGVDGAIHRAAGPRLIQACRELDEREHGVRCEVGEARITDAFNLRSRYVIHTVAPRFVGSATKSKGLNDLGIWSLTNTIYKSAKAGTDEDLAKCYSNSIRVAAQNQCRSISFPSLGTGGHAYPIELACPIAIKACVEAAKAWKLEKVDFVCFSQDDFLTYSVELGKI